MQRAQDHEAAGILLEFFSMILGIAAIVLRKGSGALQRAGVAILFFGFSLAGFTVLGIQFEIWGVQACT